MTLALEELTFVAFDTETTSLSPVSGRVIELSGIKFKLKEGRTESFDKLINPDEPISEEITQINGITNEMVKDKPKAEEIIPEFLRFIDGSETILLAHNVCFDISFVGMEIARLRITQPSHRCLDTLILARKTYPELEKYSLPGLVTQLGISQEKSHRALADSFSVKELFLKIISKTNVKTLDELINLTKVSTFSDIFDLEPPAGFELFAQAIERNQSIEMVYEGGSRDLQLRKITPLTLMKSYDKIYVLADCHLDKIQKFFCLDRIKSFKIAN